MIQTLTDTSKRLGWKHPTTYGSVKSVVNNCQYISDGTLLFGSVDDLGRLNGRTESLTNADAIKYGFFSNDGQSQRPSVGGCSSMK